MPLKPEHVEALKNEARGVLATITPDQVIKLGFAMFAMGAVAAEMVLNKRHDDVERREKALKK